MMKLKQVCVVHTIGAVENWLAGCHSTLKALITIYDLVRNRSENNDDEEQADNLSVCLRKVKTKTTVGGQSYNCNAFSRATTLDKTVFPMCLTTVLLE